MEGLVNSADAIIDEDINSVCEGLKKNLIALEGKTVLITGAAGFVCSFFVDVILKANKTTLKVPCKVIGLDNLKTGKPTNIERHLKDPSFSFSNHDITKPFDPKEKIDFIIHGASIASPSTYRKFPIQTMDVNVIGTRNMLELAREHKVESFLFMSTSEVYGDPPPEKIPTSEEYWGNVSCTGPRACYDESKRFGETMCLNFFRVHDIPVKITRSFNIYGPRLHLGDKRIIPDLMRDALAQKQLVLLSDGSPTRSFCYIKDAVDAHFRVLLSDKSGEIFNVGNEQEVSMKELAQLINKVTGGTKEVQFQESKEKDYLTDNPQRRCPDLTKIKETLSYFPTTNLEQGISRTIDWHKANNKTQ